MKKSHAIVAGVVLVGVGLAAWHFTRPKQTDDAPPPPIPVSATQAKPSEVPVYLRGIGTVTALNYVDIRPQVGGTLVDVPVREGDLVKKDEVIAVIDPRPYQAALDRAQAQLVQDQAQLQAAKLDLQRYGALVARDFASRQQYDNQVATVGKLQGAIAADQASIQEAQINLSYCVLKSPIDGRIGLRRVDPGNLIQANNSTPIISVVQEQPISVIFTLPETDVPRLRDAMRKGTLSTFADTSDTETQLAAGTLLTANNAVDPGSGTIQLRAEFSNQDLALTPGQFVNVRLQIGSAKGVTVPHDAVQHGQDGLFVFTIKPDDTAQRSPIQVAYDDGQHTVLSTGVNDGDNVIISGQTRVGSGTKVKVQKPGEGDNGGAQQQSAQR
ncbi:MAG: efflux RND transporter periplasmic adaptor subunit [Pseudonocardia sp.]|nr:efflux RND transporter periplasmic adaptor subunit [Pseudonocardia sp.]